MAIQRQKKMTKNEIREFVKDRGYSLVDFSKHIAMYMDTEWDEKHKERIYQLLSPKGTGKPSEEEMVAINFWCDVEKNPHIFASKYLKTKSLSSKIGTISDWLMGRRAFNRLQARKMVTYLKTLK